MYTIFNIIIFLQQLNLFPAEQSNNSSIVLGSGLGIASAALIKNIKTKKEDILIDKHNTVIDNNKKNVKKNINPYDMIGSNNPALIDDTMLNNQLVRLEKLSTSLSLDESKTYELLKKEKMIRLSPEYLQNKLLTTTDKGILNKAGKATGIVKNKPLSAVDMNTIITNEKFINDQRKMNYDSVYNNNVVQENIKQDQIYNYPSLPLDQLKYYDDKLVDFNHNIINPMSNETYSTSTISGDNSIINSGTNIKKKYRDLMYNL
jgi:hypothetical protein